MNHFPNLKINPSLVFMDMFQVHNGYMTYMMSSLRSISRNWYNTQQCSVVRYAALTIVSRCVLINLSFYCLASKHLLWQCTKHIAKVNGVPTYPGLLTVTNEKGEIRVCALVATKSHSQFEIALKSMQESLHLYGHSQPAIFYPDNMADKQFLEASFPSLREDIIPVEKYAHLD